MTIKNYTAGETIYREGEMPSAAYMVLSGEVELLNGSAIPRKVNKGDLFGEVNLIRAMPMHETATAKSDVSIRLLTEDQLEKLVYDSPLEVQKIIMNLAHSTELVAVKNTPLKVEEEKAPIGSTERFADAVAKATQQLETRCTQMEKMIRSLAGIEGAGEIQEEKALPEAALKDLRDMGPITPLLNDPTVNDVLINSTRNVYVERNGLLEKTSIQYKNDAEVQALADKIVTLVGRKLDRRRPIADARLLDGSRVNIIAPPLSVDGTTISIRKFSTKKLTVDSMKQQHNVSEQLGEFLKSLAKCKLNIIISGGTGSGKTTLLNAVSQFIDHNERIVTVEDAAELQLQQPHVVRLETRPPTSVRSKYEEVTIRDLVRNALRMRPDRIIVGEVRGPEAFDMMQAMNTGHEGSLTTIHANHPRDCLSRLENMINMADMNIPLKSMRYQIASAIQVIVQISRMRDGHRRITHVSEIVGMEGDMITMHDLFNFIIDGEDDKGHTVGHFKWTGIMPRFLRRIAYYGETDRIEKALGVKMPKKF